MELNRLVKSSTCIRAEPWTTLELVQALLARFGAQDPTALAELFASRVDWQVSEPAAAGWSNGTRSRREVEAVLRSLFGALGLEELTVRRLLIDGEDAVVLGRTRWRTAGPAVDYLVDFALSVSVHRGEVDECWLMRKGTVATTATTAAP